MLSKFKRGTKKIELTHPVVPPRTPSMEYCEDQNGTILYIRHSQGVKMNTTVFSLKKDTVELEITIIQQGSSHDYKWILKSGPWARGLSLRSTRQACLLSPLNPQSLRQRTMNCTGPVHQPRMDCTSEDIAQAMILFDISIYGTSSK